MPAPAVPGTSLCCLALPFLAVYKYRVYVRLTPVPDTVYTDIRCCFVQNTPFCMRRAAYATAVRIHKRNICTGHVARRSLERVARRRWLNLIRGDACFMHLLIGWRVAGASFFWVCSNIAKVGLRSCSRAVCIRSFRAVSYKTLDPVRLWHGCALAPLPTFAKFEHPWRKRVRACRLGVRAGAV